MKAAQTNAPTAAKAERTQRFVPFVALFVLSTLTGVVFCVTTDVHKKGSRRSDLAEAPTGREIANRTGSNLTAVALSQLLRCLNASKQSTAVDFRLISLGNSFSREMIEGLQLRIEPVTSYKHIDFDLKYKQYGIYAAQRFHAKISKESLGIPPPMDDNTVAVVSRGAADILHFAYSLTEYHDEILELARSLLQATSKPRGLVWRLPHLTPNIHTLHHRECSPSVAAYRQTAACAIAAANSEVNNKSGLHVTLMDANDLIASEMTMERDGVHIGVANSAVLTDLVIHKMMCPTLQDALHPSLNTKVFFSDDANVISARYRCDDLKRVPAAQWESQLYGLGPRYGCRCVDEKQNFNDRCALSITFQGHHPMVQQNNEFSRHFRSYVCKLRAQATTNVPTNLSHGLWAPSRDVQISESWLEEIVMDLCVAPAAKMTLLQNLGYVPPLAVVDAYHGKPVGLCTAPDTRAERQKTPWCRDRATRISTAVADVTALWRRLRRDSSSPPPAIGQCPKQANEFAEEFLQIALGLVCHPLWAPSLQTNRTAAAVRARRAAFHAMRKYQRIVGPLVSPFGRALRE